MTDIEDKVIHAMTHDNYTISKEYAHSIITNLINEAKIKELKHIGSGEDGEVWYEDYSSGHLELHSLDERIKQLSKEITA